MRLSYLSQLLLIWHFPKLKSLARTFFEDANGLNSRCELRDLDTTSFIYSFDSEFANDRGLVRFRE